MLIQRRAAQRLHPFGVLALDGRDVRGLPLLRRKAFLRRVVPRDSRCALYADYIVGTGRALFAEVCARDLEGVVAKLAQAPYAEPTTWIKIKNREYTGARDRHRLLA